MNRLPKSRVSGHGHRSISEFNMDHIELGNPSTEADTRAGDRLREARLAKRYSLEDLAIATGLTEAEISAVEDGSSSEDNHLERIEHALG